MSTLPSDASLSRIQREKRALIRDAALGVFSRNGFRGATIDQIADAAEISKPNLLYYYPSKEAIHSELLAQQLATWLDPLRAMSSDGDPVEEILAYVERKLEMAQAYPRESRLFANEILHGAPNLMDVIEGELKSLVDDKCAQIQEWMDDGKLRSSDPYHLIFSIWALTQHYADFDVQVSAILGPKADTRFDDARAFLTDLYRRQLTPDDLG